MPGATQRGAPRNQPDVWRLSGRSPLRANAYGVAAWQVWRLRWIRSNRTSTNARRQAHPAPQPDRLWCAKPSSALALIGSASARLPISGLSQHLPRKGAASTTCVRRSSSPFRAKRDEERADLAARPSMFLAQLPASSEDDPNPITSSAGEPCRPHGSRRSTASRRRS
jgi:hypothetical protein